MEGTGTTGMNIQTGAWPPQGEWGPDAGGGAEGECRRPPPRAIAARHRCLPHSIVPAESISIRHTHQLTKSAHFPCAVSGPGAYGKLERAAEDDTGLRPGQGTGGHLGPPPPPAVYIQHTHPKEHYLEEHYGGSEQTGAHGEEVSAAPAHAPVAPAEAAEEVGVGPGSPRVLHQARLTVIDDTT
jgi:hypothetical protein